MLYMTSSHISQAHYFVKLDDKVQVTLEHVMWSLFMRAWELSCMYHCRRSTSKNTLHIWCYWPRFCEGKLECQISNVSFFYRSLYSMLLTMVHEEETQPHKRNAVGELILFEDVLGSYSCSQVSNIYLKLRSPIFKFQNLRFCALTPTSKHLENRSGYNNNRWIR